VAIMGESTEEKFCHANRHHVPASSIVKRKGRKDICKGCAERMNQRRKESM